MDKETLEKIGEIGALIQQLAPLAIAGISGAAAQIRALIEDLNGADLKAALDSAAAVGHAEVAKLKARAEEAKQFLAQNPVP